MAMTFNAQILQTYAGKLYRRADALVLSHILGYSFVGLVGLMLLSTFVKPMHQSLNDNSYLGVSIVVVFGLIGYSVGSSKALTLRVQAQTALCQLQIEHNTRTLVLLQGEKTQDNS